MRHTLHQENLIQMLNEMVGEGTGTTVKKAEEKSARTAEDNPKLINCMKKCKLVPLLIHRQDELDDVDVTLKKMRCTRSSSHVFAYLALLSILDKDKDKAQDPVEFLEKFLDIDTQKARYVWGNFEVWAKQFPSDISSKDFLTIEVPDRVLTAAKGKKGKTNLDLFVLSVLKQSKSDNQVKVITKVNQAVKWQPKFEESPDYWTLKNGVHFKLDENKAESFITTCRKYKDFLISRNNENNSMEIKIDFRDPGNRSIPNPRGGYNYFPLNMTTRRRHLPATRKTNLPEKSPNMILMILMILKRMAQKS